MQSRTFKHSRLDATLTEKKLVPENLLKKVLEKFGKFDSQKNWEPWRNE